MDYDAQIDTVQQLDVINAEVKGLTLRSFDADIAWELGCAIRNRLRELAPQTSAVVNISLTNGTLLFHAASRPGALPDNSVWIERKRNTVMRWGLATYAMHLKFQGDEGSFASKYGLGPETAGKFAIHGGAVSVYVKNVEGFCAIVIVSGLKQDEDHAVVVEALQRLQSKQA